MFDFCTCRLLCRSGFVIERTGYGFTEKKIGRTRDSVVWIDAVNNRVYRRVVAGCSGRDLDRASLLSWAKKKMKTPFFMKTISTSLTKSTAARSSAGTPWDLSGAWLRFGNSRVGKHLWKPGSQIHARDAALLQ